MCDREREGICRACGDGWLGSGTPASGIATAWCCWRWEGLTAVESAERVDCLRRTVQQWVYRYRD